MHVCVLNSYKIYNIRIYIFKYQMADRTVYSDMYCTYACTTDVDNQLTLCMYVCMYLCICMYVFMYVCGINVSYI